MIAALASGLTAGRRNWGLAVLVLATNLGLALLLTVPTAVTVERDLKNTESARSMLYGFDYPWWSQWNDAQTGYAKALAPEIFGIGFAYRNVDLLLKGELLGGFLASDAGLDPVVFGLAWAYLLLQTFLAGGMLGVFRSESAGWTLRGVLHGSGFYFGRLFRVALIALLIDAALFAVNAPLARWADLRARESVSENAATAWTLGRHALLLLALLTVNMLSTYAKAIVVLEERSSAILAWVSAIGFCAANAVKTIGHYLLVVLLGALLLGAWHAVDGAYETTGYKTQLFTLLSMQALVFGRIALRLSLLAGALALYRRQTSV
jgi:hypothetical protein